MQTTANHPFYTVAEVAELIGCSRVRAYQLISEGLIPAVRVSPRRIRIPRTAFDSWVASQAAEALANVRDSEASKDAP